MLWYDVIIKNGVVFDGKGNKSRQIDVGIAGDEIKRVKNLGAEVADKIIDAKGKYVVPGFIDLTNHSDTRWTIFKDPTQESLIHQGITTIIGGNCGTSLAPFIGEDSIQEMKRWIDISEVNINWQTTEEFLSVVKNQKLGVNFGTLTGLNTIQSGIMQGKSEIPSEDKINQMKLLFENSFEQGSFGISANLGLSRLKSSRDSELISLFSTAKEYNVLVKHHLEDEGENILPAVSRLISIARKSGARVHINHFKALGKKSWSLFEEAIEMIKTARQSGIQITCDFFPYTKTGSILFMLLPSWFRKLPEEEARKILQSGKDQKRVDLIDYLKKLTLHYDRMIIASASSETDVVGNTIEQISKNSELSGEEVILNLIETSDFRVSIFNEVISEENIEKIAQEKFSVITSDGVGYSIKNKNLSINKKDFPHPRSFGTFPKSFEMLVKEKPLLNWEEAIYKMTGMSAEILGIKDRGTIENMKKADVVIFDPEKISGKSTYEEPFQYSEGVEYVLINGTIVLDNGKLTGKLPGYVLKHQK